MSVFGQPGLAMSGLHMFHHAERGAQIPPLRPVNVKQGRCIGLDHYYASAQSGRRDAIVTLLTVGQIACRHMPANVDMIKHIDGAREWSGVGETKP